MEQIEKIPLTSQDIKDEQLKKLKEVIPEAFTEGLKIDWDRLRLTLGEAIDAGKERYGMNFPGKADCFKTIQQPSIATLVPAKEESVNFDTTENLFIEGDNLEVLKLLQKSYLGKVKMIYIDPPYNTGNDFIYPDDYSENLQTYLEYTGQVDNEGRKFGTNPETDGRFHSRWLSMMYPRLFLAKNLLKEDGLIFISIDDNEYQNLRLICNEIFGEENFIDNIIWKKRYGGGAKEKYLVSLHEYILVFAKNKSAVNPLFVPNSEEAIKRYYIKKDENYEKRGPYRTHPLEATKSMGERKNLVYPIPAPDGTEVLPKRQWLWGKERAFDALSKNEIEFLKDKDGNWSVNTKQYLKDEEGKVRESKAFSIIDDVYTQHGTNEIIELFGNAQIFSFPKPTELLIKLINIGLQNEPGVVLDLFAGSASLADAIIRLNQKDNGSRKFICIQLPEKVEEGSEAKKHGFDNIAQISRARIIKAIDRAKEELNKNTLFKSEEIDLGFKSFTLSPSNFKIWNSSVSKLPEVIQKQLFEHIDHISDGAKQESILTELLLKSGFELTTKTETLLVAGKLVYSIADGELLICLDKELNHEVIKGIAEMQPSRVVCLDEGFKGENADALKTNAVQIMKSKGVVNFRTV